MGKKFFVWHHLLATLVTVTAPEHQLAEKVSGHSIYPIKLTLVSAEWTGVWILLEPVSLAVPAKRFFTNNTLNWIFQNVVADTTDKFSQESFHVRFIEYAILLETVL